MATSYYEAEDCYSVTAGSFPLTISVEIWNGQGGAYHTFNGIDLIGPNKDGKIGSIDEAQEWITVSATVKDKLEETNWTSVSIFLKDSSKEDRLEFGPYKREVSTHLDTVIYTIKIKILKP